MSGLGSTATTSGPNGPVSPYANVAVDIDQVKLALQHDPEFFIHFFMGDALTVPVPPLHIDVFQDMIDPQYTRVLEAIPRDHAKTTLAKLAMAWHFLFSPFSFGLYVSDTHTIAASATHDIADFFDLPNFRAVYGVVAWATQQKSAGFFRFTIPGLIKKFILKAIGAGQQIRGSNYWHRRPQIVVCDDLESVDPQSGNIVTEQQFDGLKRWFWGSFMKSFDTFGHKIIMIGNLLQQQSILYENLHLPSWHCRLYGALKADGTSLWPDRWSLEALAADFTEYVKLGLVDLWFAEMMNTPMAPGGGIIQPDQINYRAARLPEECKYGFLTLDLASSTETWAHETVLAAHGWIPETEEWQIVETKGWHGIDPISLFDESVAMMERWRFYVTGIESVAFQAALSPIFTYLAALRGKTHLQFLPVPVGRAAKPMRIATWAGQLMKGEGRIPTYALTEGDFAATTQLLMFNPRKNTNKDDVIDCCAAGVLMQGLHMAAILSQVRHAPILPGAIGNTYDIMAKQLVSHIH